MPTGHFITLAEYYNLSLNYLSGLTDTPKNKIRQKIKAESR